MARLWMLLLLLLGLKKEGVDSNVCGVLSRFGWR